MLTAKWSELYAYNAAQIKAVTIIGGAHGLLAYSAKLTMENMTLELRCHNGEETAAALSTWAACLSL